jgi:hypothetical protein
VKTTSLYRLVLLHPFITFVCSLSELCAVPLGSVSLHAAEYRDYPCYRLTKTPTLDGKIEPEIWANVPTAGGSYFHPRGPQFAKRPTWFKAGWTSDAVWLAICCKEPAMKKVRATGGEGGALWNDDSVEIACVPPGGRLQYLINPAGARWEAKLPYGGSQWQSRVQKEADGWTLEVKISSHDLGCTPDERAQWPFTVARMIPGSASGQPVLGTGANIVGGFDRLVFARRL